jgi:TnpA family transposase
MQQSRRKHFGDRGPLDLTEIIRERQSVPEASVRLALDRIDSTSRNPHNRLYQAFRELGRVVRTVFLLEYLSNAKLREQITATTNKVEAYNGFAKWLNFGGQGVIDTLDPVEQEKHLKYNHLVANAAAIQNVIDLTRAVRELQADGTPAAPGRILTASSHGRGRCLLPAVQRRLRCHRTR